MTTDVPSQVAPRGTDRVRRRAAQEAAKVTAQNEAATLIPPRGEEKKRLIAKNKADELARFGPSKSTRTKALQAENRDKALVQDRELAFVKPSPLARLEPGQQVDARTARLLAKQGDREERDNIEKAAKAAGVAVRNTLHGRPAHDRRSTARRVAQHNALNAKTTAATK